MKKTVITKKKRIKIFSENKRGKKGICKAACFLAAAAIVLGNAKAAYAAEEKAENTAAENAAAEGENTASQEAYENRTVSYVYHMHIGTEREQAGCYQEPVYHLHTGGTEGGGCFQTPVYHVHQGSEEAGGSCFGKEIFHRHSGDEETGGDCYEAVYHSHGGGCYAENTCNYTVSKESAYETYDNYCYHHGNTPHSKARAVEHHPSCGAGNVNTVVSYCRKCGLYGDSGSHSYSRLVCTAAGTQEGYRFACSKTEETVDAYELDCSKTGETVDSYELGCKKTAETVEGYGLNCGKDENSACGKIVLTSKTLGNSEKAVVRAEFEDLTGGELLLEEEPFTWYDKGGRLLGSGSSLEVGENGSYRIQVGVLNEDINKSSLRSEIEVRNIVKPEQNPDGEGEKDKEGEDKEEKEEENHTGEEPEGTPLPLPTPVPEEAFPPEADTADETAGEGGNKATWKKTVDSERNAELTEEAARKTPEVIKKSDTVRARENKGEAKEQLEYKAIPKESGGSGFFSSKTAKIITLTTGTILLLGGIFAGFWLLRFSVAVYNDDGKGKWIYLGQCIVKTQEECYSIFITDRMTERAATNRYCIRPGLFLDFRSEEEELLVCREQKRVSVFLNKEMIVTL